MCIFIVRVVVVSAEVVRAKYDAGEREEAIRLAYQWPRGASDPDEIRGWAETLEYIGLWDEAIQAWERLSALVSTAEPWERMADIYLDQAAPAKAIEALERAVACHSERLETYTLLGELYEDADQLNDARRAYQCGWDRLEHPLLKSRLDHLPVSPVPASTDLGYEPSDEEVVHILQYFQGREGVYARQWVDRRGHTGYQPVHAPLTPDVFRRHLRGDITVGVYPIRVDNTVFFIAWDIDINKSVLKRYRRNPSRLAELTRATHDAAARIHTWLETQGIPALIEDSGYKGRHVWVFLQRPLEARIARQIGKRIAALHPLPPELHYEIFPRQDAVPAEKLGNLIKIPLGIHRRTGRRCLFLKPDGSMDPDPIRVLLQTPRIEPEILIAAVRHLVEVELEPTEPESRYEQEAREIVAAQAPPYHPESDPEFMTLVTFCPTLRAIIEKAYHKGFLEYDEQLVVVHTLGHLTHGVDAVNMVLRQCVNANERLFLKSPLRGNPMSCPKIRRRVPEITTQYPCECPQAPELGYPTPLLFLKIRDTYDPDIWNQMTLERLAESFIRLTEQMAVLQRQYQQVHDRLKTIFEHRGDHRLTCGNYQMAYDADTGTIEVIPLTPEGGDEA